jgi:hypothetical protein
MLLVLELARQRLRLLGVVLSHLPAMMLLLLLLAWMLLVLELALVMTMTPETTMMMTTKTIKSLGGIKCFHRTIPKLRMRTLMATHHPKMALRLIGCVSVLRKRIGTCHDLTMQGLLTTTHPYYSLEILIVEMMNMAAWTWMMVMVMAIDMCTFKMTLWKWALVTVEDVVA